MILITRHAARKYGLEAAVGGPLVVDDRKAFSDRHAAGYPIPTAATARMIAAAAATEGEVQRRHPAGPGITALERDRPWRGRWQGKPPTPLFNQPPAGAASLSARTQKWTQNRPEAGERAGIRPLDLLIKSQLLWRNNQS